MKINTLFFLNSKYLFIPLIFAFLFSGCSPSQKAELDAHNHRDTIQIASKYLFDINLDHYEVTFDTIKNGWNWNQLFTGFNIDQFNINQTVERLKDSTIGVNYIIAGKPFATFSNKKDLHKFPSILVYELDKLSYVTIHVKADTIEIGKTSKPVEIKEKTISGTIEQHSNLSNELAKNFPSYSMTAKIAEAFENIYGWSIDFFKLQADDKFVAVYDEKSVEGTPYAVENIKYIWFQHKGRDLYAFYYKDEANSISGYYDEEGNEMKRPFLMAPVKYTRISSGYSSNRFHPVQKRYKSHLGTDYAAPTGTPIYATADGTITKATQSNFNGKYVKIKHNSVYETQYLHMSRIGDGIRPGIFVKQGDVIGYVGQTGLATGPHVCYRFWKNGQQIDHRSEDFPKSEPMKEEVKPAYLEYIQPFKQQLDEQIKNLSAPSPTNNFTPEV